jgi:hypothetical protein
MSYLHSLSGLKREMSMPKNKNVVEIHGCIVCARSFNILAVYDPDGRLMDCTVTSHGGHIVPDKQQPLVACDTHMVEEIEAAYKKWHGNAKESDDEQDKE